MTMKLRTAGPTGRIIPFGVQRIWI